ncbi:NlpC/P60 family protein [Sagittula sp. SSi028]|uniref:C40 family peptidase n=1 Tax=Sagittula sp. SSi028 TaxID=3400636 RepID=UPI003AF7A19F
MDRRLRPATDRVVARDHAQDFPDLRPVDPEPMFVSLPVTDLCRSPDGARDRQLMYGTPCEVLDRVDGWAFVRVPTMSGYVGWLHDAALRPSDDRPPAVLRVCVQQTHAYSQPDFKQPETLALSEGSRLFGGAVEGRFIRTEAGWVPQSHLSETSERDPVAVAERYLGTPYLWGGNSVWGVDCSGLVWAGLAACGYDCPGDSDMQEARLGQTLPAGTAPQRGDLMFWKGHVAWVADGDRLLHANAHHMAVRYEPIAEAIARIEAQGDGPVTRHARLK